MARVARVARLNFRVEGRVRQQCAQHVRCLVVIVCAAKVGAEEQSWTFA